jgi:hypothetical protein
VREETERKEAERVAIEKVKRENPGVTDEDLTVRAFSANVKRDDRVRRAREKVLLSGGAWQPGMPVDDADEDTMADIQAQMAGMNVGGGGGGARRGAQAEAGASSSASASAGAFGRGGTASFSTGFGGRSGNINHHHPTFSGNRGRDRRPNSNTTFAPGRGGRGIGGGGMPFHPAFAEPAQWELDPEIYGENTPQQQLHTAIRAGHWPAHLRERGIPPSPPELLDSTDVHIEAAYYPPQEPHHGGRYFGRGGYHWIGGGRFGRRGC